ncbi:MAG: diguanylate cyclase [Oscillospiraceae bacterium]|nr:diguanylate cyclase [Oscillospiraceae bacterium]
MDHIMLIVDDTELNREILKVLFQSHFEIMEAENGEEALETLQGCQGSIDIVLLDLMMPGTSGFQLLERRKTLDYFKNVPVVVVTGSGQMEDQIRAFDLGASDFIQKPFIPEIVVSRVNNVMASSQRMLSIEMEAQKLKIKSELDEMTGLCNKTTSELAMNETLKACKGRLDVMLVIDIDNFKAVNDSSGHQAGDHVIRIIADLISGRFRKSDLVGRIGGDEFCVLMVDVPSMEIVHRKVNELIQIMRYKPNLTIPEYVTLSIGVASNGRADTSYPELFKKADEALYLAKNNGKAQYREYGVEPVDADKDERPALLLLSSSRSVCSTVQTLAPIQLRVVEVLRFEDLNSLGERDKKNIALMYVDVSDLDEDTTPY